jgi:hypothetical protein
MGLVAVMDGNCGVDPPNYRADEPNKGEIPHSHRGYLNDAGLQCDNSLIFHYFRNRIVTDRSKLALFILEPNGLYGFMPFAAA